MLFDLKYLTEAKPDTLADYFIIQNSSGLVGECGKCKHKQTVRDDDEFKERFYKNVSPLKDIPLDKDMIVAGGCVVSAVVGDKMTRSQDVDIFVLLPENQRSKIDPVSKTSGTDEVSESEEEEIEGKFDPVEYVRTKIENFINSTIKRFEKLNYSDPKVIYTTQTTSFSFIENNTYKRYTFQIMHPLWNSINHVLNAFDLGSSCVAFDGERVFLNERGVWSLKNRCNVLDFNRYYRTYNSRLIKYFRRGFRIAIPNYKPEYLVDFYKYKNGGAAKKSRYDSDSDESSDDGFEKQPDPDDSSAESDSEDEAVSSSKRMKKISIQKEESDCIADCKYNYYDFDHLYATKRIGYLLIKSAKLHKASKRLLLTNRLSLAPRPKDEPEASGSGSSSKGYKYQKKTSSSSESKENDYGAFFKNIRFKYGDLDKLELCNSESMTYGVQVNLRYWNQNLYKRFSYEKGRLRLYGSDGDTYKKLNLATVNKIFDPSFVDKKDSYWILKPRKALEISCENKYAMHRHPITIDQWMSQEQVKIPLVIMPKLTKVAQSKIFKTECKTSGGNSSSEPKKKSVKKCAPKKKCKAVEF